MGIDPLRFISEFGDRISHVHAKDAEIYEDLLYDFGNLQTATQATPMQFGSYQWRYCIPGHGAARWGLILRMLKDAKYSGMVSIELEDMHFNGSEEGEKRGILASRDFLTHV
jgi:sugar phosphate isomerase/epimerase